MAAGNAAVRLGRRLAPLAAECSECTGEVGFGVLLGDALVSPAFGDCAPIAREVLVKEDDDVQPGKGTGDAPKAGRGLVQDEIDVEENDSGPRRTNEAQRIGERARFSGDRGAGVRVHDAPERLAEVVTAISDYYRVHRRGFDSYLSLHCSLSTTVMGPFGPVCRAVRIANLGLMDVHVGHCRTNGEAV